MPRVLLKMPTEEYYCGTASCYSDLWYSIITEMREIGLDVSIAQFEYLHEGIEWKEHTKKVVYQFYKLNNQFVARAWSENKFHYKLRTVWLLEATRFLFDTCKGKKELVPLKMRHILKWVHAELKLSPMQWPVVYIILSLNGIPLITPVDTSDIGCPLE